MAERKPTQKRKDFVKNNVFVKTSEESGKNHADGNTKVVPADCYGTLCFNASNCSNSKYIRFWDSETEPSALYKLMTEHWKLEPPTLLISVTGGAKSFAISSRLRRDFLGGLRKVASTPGAWVISGGTDTGVMKMVGDANRGTENICVGVVTWGVLANRKMLEANEERKSDGTFRYGIGSYLNLPTGLSYLDKHHTHFLLVDDGSVENWGVEIEFRGKFEAYIMKDARDDGQRVPTVLLVLEGGPGTLKTVYNAVESKTPCVLVKGSGRVTDMLVYAIEHAETAICKDKKCEYIVDMVRELIPELPDYERTGDADQDKQKLEKSQDDCYNLMKRCVKDGKNIFTIVDQELELDTDDAILTALLNDPNTSASDYKKLELTLQWDRVDLAEKILSPMNQWNADKLKGKKEVDEDGKKELERLLIMALVKNNVKFVKILLDYGVSMSSLLNKQVLEILYAICTPSLLLDHFGNCEKESVNGLDEGDKCFFESLASEVQQKTKDKNLEKKRNQNLPPSAPLSKAVTKIDLLKIKKNWLWNLLDDVPTQYLEKIICEDENQGKMLKDPYLQLFVWSVLNNFGEMAVYLWQFLSDSIAAVLFAAALTKNMRKILLSRSRNVQDTDEKKLTESLDTYTSLSLDLLETCYKNNETDTVVVVTKPNEFFNNKCSALDFAFATGQQDFVAHRGIQGILDKEWSGSIKSTHSLFRIFATILLPLMVLDMDIETKSKARNRPFANFCRKISYFYTESLLVKFVKHTMGYILFLVLFSYVALNKNTAEPEHFSWMEILLVITVSGYLCQEIYQLTHVNAPNLHTKIRIYILDFWNIFDWLCIILFYFGLGLRSSKSTLNVGYLIYSIDVGLWIARIIHILHANRISGPYVVLIGKMLKDVLHFLLILVIFGVSYGVTMCGLLEHDEEKNHPYHSVYRPYFHLFGELFLEEDSASDKTKFNTRKHNSYAEPIALVYLALYMLIANILLLNLLIAIFNSTYGKVMATAARTWKFQRYQLIMEYAQQRMYWCPPFNFIEFLYMLMRWLYRRQCCRGQKEKDKIKTVLTMRRIIKKNPIKEQTEWKEQFERKSLNEVLRKLEDNENQSKRSGTGGAGMSKLELEKKFLDLQENHETLSEKNERNMKKNMENNFEQQEKKMVNKFEQQEEKTVNKFEQHEEKMLNNFEQQEKKMVNKFEQQEKKMVNKFEQQEEKMDHKFEQQEEKMDHKFEQQEEKMDHKFEQQEEKMDHKFEQQEEKMDHKFEQQEEKMDHKFEQQEERMDKKFKEQEEKITALLEELKQSLKNTP